MADLDAMLDDAAEETIPSVFDLDTQLKSTKKIDDVKPWLAFSSNVPPAIRDKWSKMVKTDALSTINVSNEPPDREKQYVRRALQLPACGDRILTASVSSCFYFLYSYSFPFANLNFTMTS